MTAHSTNPKPTIGLLQTKQAHKTDFHFDCQRTHSLTLIGKTLKVEGKTGTLALADLHNRRKIPYEAKGLGHIDRTHTALNTELISLENDTLIDAVFRTLREKNFDFNASFNKRKDRGFAIEWIFSVSLGFEGDHQQLYADCINCLRSLYPNCPLVHAVIHYDENEPHMHVIMVPLVGNRLRASEVLSYKGAYRWRLQALHKILGNKYGLTLKTSLKGAIKKRAAEAVIEALEKFDVRSSMGNIWPAIKSSIRNSPDGFLDPLGITLEQLVPDEARVISQKGMRHG
mgnify:FL=1